MERINKLESRDKYQYMNRMKTRRASCGQWSMYRGGSRGKGGGGGGGGLGGPSYGRVTSPRNRPFIYNL